MISKIVVGSVVAMAACSVSALSIWINEFHYDNDGGDTGEFIEIAGSAGTLPDGVTLHLYNGSNGAVYNTLILSGMEIPDQMNGFGTLSLETPGLQNGIQDGIALVFGASVIQFLSYEGAFVAAVGPAAGMTSVDIGVAESTTTPLGSSLQLTGTGEEYADFMWSGPSAASPGHLNAGQVFATPDGGSSSLLLSTVLLGLWRARRFV